MIYPSGDELEKQVGSKYSLVIAVSKRAKQLKEGAPRLIETRSRNHITIALEEIAAGMLNIGVATVEDQAVQQVYETVQPTPAESPRTGEAEALRQALATSEEEAEIVKTSEPKEASANKEPVEEELDGSKKSKTKKAKK
jgi:DNA-directed RNA polymerase subunit omega